ncbi:hypothetical protein [Rariglobus hedericola]|uniref:Uncharacterized protein n=1 Tax=Rariglobus hedericola TaxID=2597822 RepID=A0A556QMN0_9BACT|nr:hypothetical protein [Rariglobus hedericola]TSJ77894.1 hypothetical protein FPL22_00875 [Rariglobus hedericola]
MVALNLRYVAELVGSGRLGFVATNGLQDYLVIEGQQEDEYRLRIKEGWRVAEIRPICRSINPKLIHSHPDLLKARAFSYTLVILEHPALKAREGKHDGDAVISDDPIRPGK